MKAAVCSLRFAPGHPANMRAYYELFKALGCDTRLFLDPGYRGYVDEAEHISFSAEPDEILKWKPDLVFSYNVASSNVSLADKCRKKGISFYYVLHEPITDLNRLLSLGKRMPRRVMANIVNYRTSKKAYKVILASENGKNQYLQTMSRCNSSYDVFPLMFCDDYDHSVSIERRYFSYIGGFTEGRGCNEFLNFAEYALQRDPDIRFMIASRDNVSEDRFGSAVREAVKAGRFVVHSGKPMTVQEISEYYRETICAWNVYKKSTQSGVVPNALMQGTPLLVSDRPDVRECMIEDGREGKYISLSYDHDEIYAAYQYIRDHVQEMSANARACFMKHNHYSGSLDLAARVFEVPKD